MDGLIFISFRGENNQPVPYFTVILGKVCGMKNVLCSLEGASWALGLEGSQGAPQLVMLVGSVAVELGMFLGTVI